MIHRLVAQAFIPNPDDLPCVNHKDGNKLNNSVENLEGCSYSENRKHAYDNGLSQQRGYPKSVIVVIFSDLQNVGLVITLKNMVIHVDTKSITSL